MKKETIAHLKEEISLFEEMTEKFINKEVSMKDYKGFSGGFGSYAQRGGEAFMLRLRMNQGILSKDKLHFIVETLKKYNLAYVHLTTCQTCQLHDVPYPALGDIMREALDHDIVTRGGGGDFPRNVMCSPLSGVEQDEYFDVIPYASLVGDYVLEKIDTYQLPRKLKIAFSNSNKNKTHATFRDLGFCANMDGSFDVYCAGGLGNNPKMGVCVGTHISPNDILYYVEAMVLTFQKHGNYENRAKARTRYMQESLGIEGLQTAFQDSLNIVYEQDLQITIQPNIMKKVGNGKLDSKGFIDQKQPELYALKLHPIGGDITLAQLLEIDHLIASMPYVELRISPQQDLYLINLNKTEAKQFLLLREQFAKTQFECSVSCVGASVCQVGVRDSNKLLHDIFNAVLPYQFADGVLPILHISGCTSSCGTQQIAGLGFQGSVKLIDKQPQNAFVLSVCGEEDRNKEHFGEVCGSILEKDIPSFLIALGKTIQDNHSDFLRFYKEQPTMFHHLIEQYCGV